MPHGTGYKISIKAAAVSCSRFVVLGKDQLSFFTEAESSQDHKAEDPKPDTIFVEAHERKKKRSHAEMLKHLPEEEVLMEILEGQRLCRKCGGKMKPFAENVIRPFTLGRKNWLFCDTPKDAEASAVVYSLVESAKANGIEPFAYLQHVLVQHKEIVIGESINAPGDERYMCAYCEKNEILGLYSDLWGQ